MEINFNELIKFFEKQELFSMAKVEWWLLKYSKLYKKTYDFVHNQHLFTTDDGSVIRLPSFGEPTEEEIFLELFKALDKVSKFHRSEKYFEQEIINYHKIKHSEVDLRNWVSKNEDIGAENYVCFLIDYLDYDENDEEEHLYIFVHNSKELEIYIDRQDFKNTINFLEIFNELYWVQEILPESLDKIKIEISE